VPLASLNDLVFGGWDVFPTIVTRVRVRPRFSRRRTSTLSNRVAGDKTLDRRIQAGIREEPPRSSRQKREVSPGARGCPQGRHRNVQTGKKVSRCVMVWCASTEAYLQAGPVHSSSAPLKRGCERTIRPYPEHALCLCRIDQRIPFINGAPNLTVTSLPCGTGDQEEPACGRQRLQDRANPDEDHSCPGLKARMLGWPVGIRQTSSATGTALSWMTRILQDQRNEQALCSGHHFAASGISEALRGLLPQGDHQLLPAQRRRQEGWDCIDIFGWLGYPCRSKSIFLQGQHPRRSVGP